MKWNVLCAVLFFCTISTLYAQETERQCLSLVKECYRNLNYAPAENTNNIYYLHYSANTVMRDSSKNNNSRTEAKMYLSNKKVRLLSNEMEVYQDEEDAFTVLPSKKTIYRSYPTLNFDKENRKKQLSMLQDTLLSMSEVSSCKVVKENKADKEVVLIPNAKAKQLFGVGKMVFYINSAEKNIEKVIINYLPPKEILSVTYAFHSVEYNYKTDILIKPVLPLFIDKSGQLIPEYKGYRFIDNKIKYSKGEKEQTKK